MQSKLQIGDDVDVELSRDGMDVDLSSPHMPSPRGSCSLSAKKDEIRKRGWSYSVKKKTTGEKNTVGSSEKTNPFFSSHPQLLRIYLGGVDLP